MPSLPLLMWAVAAPAMAQVKVDDAASSAADSTTQGTATARFDTLFAEQPLERVQVVEVPTVPKAVSQRMQDCVAASLARDAEHQGRLELTITVAGGRVSKTAASTDEIQDPLLIECAQQKLVGQTVPDVDEAEFPWVFIVDKR